jgi:hypothetical protein
METNWPFDQPRNCATFVMRQVLEGSESILSVTHYADDHSWSFVGTTDANVEDAMLVCLERVVDLDPTILEVADMAPGWRATRRVVGGPWSRSMSPPDEDED